MSEAVGTHRVAYLLGSTIRGIILGGLLSIAIVEMWAETNDVRVFRYQNF